VSAEELAGVTATNLHEEFATVLSTRQVLERVAQVPAAYEDAGAG
jgi:hypothetical protein